MQQIPGTSLPGNERGAALIVALIMLVLISLIGASSLKSASVTEKLSSNDYQKNITFQASESAADVAFADLTMISTVVRTEQATAETAVDISVNNADARVIMTPVGVGPLLGTQINGNGGAVGQRLMLTSTGRLNANTNIQSVTVHGVVRELPGAANSASYD